MDNNNKQHSTTRAVSGGGLSIAGVTFLVLTILKLTNCIDMGLDYILDACPISRNYNRCNHHKPDNCIHYLDHHETE